MESLHGLINEIQRQTSIEENKWTQACGIQKQQLVGGLGLLWKRVDEITSLDTKIDNEALALALQSQVSFTNVE